MDKPVTQRPGVLDRVSETQILELERQFNEGDRQYWNELATSYGWSPQECDEVWTWFGERPTEGGQGQGGKG